MKVTFVVSAILGLALGARLGYDRGTELSELTQSMEPIAAGSVVSEYAARQFQHADIHHACQAVQLEISVRERLRALDHDSTVDGHLGLAYVRLAMVEEAAGQKEAERLALKQARGWFRPPGPDQELSDEQLKDTLRRIDRAGIATTNVPRIPTDVGFASHASLE